MIDDSRPMSSMTTTVNEEAEENVPVVEIPEYADECFTIRFDETSTKLAAGYNSGDIGINDMVKKSSNQLNYQKKYKISEFPITCVRWKPHFKTTLLAVSAEGFIYQIHSASGKKLQIIEEKDNPLMCCDYSNDGLFFATAGNDKVVRLYDDNTKTMLSKLESRKLTMPQHSNRIFAVKFSCNDPNLMFSGGWDNTILLYDIRAKQVQNYLYGPHICGDAMDMKGDLLLTVSWGRSDQIQIFDIRKLNKKAVFQVTLDGTNDTSLENSSYLYSCRFNPTEPTFCVTGSNKNLLRIYDYRHLDKEVLPGQKDERLKTRYQLKSLKSPCYCCDFDNEGKVLAYGCSEDKVNFQYLEFTK